MLPHFEIFFIFFIYFCVVGIIKLVPRILTKECRAATWYSSFFYFYFESCLGSITFARKSI